MTTYAEAIRLMGQGVQRPSYPPDLVTPIPTLRDAIQAQIDRARQLQQQVEHPLRLAA